MTDDTQDTNNSVVKEIIFNSCADEIYANLSDSYFFEGNDLYSDGLSPDHFREVPEDSISNIVLNFINSIEKQFSETGKIDKSILAENFKENIEQELQYCFDCIRVWSAWSYGTMTGQDFIHIPEDSDRVAEFVGIGLSVSDKVVSYLEKNKLSEIINKSTLENPNPTTLKSQKKRM